MGAHEKEPGRAALSAGPLRVARLCPLPIGVLAWRAPEPTLTVVVKATFVLGADGTSTLAAAQEPLSIDRPAPGGSFGDLDRASDFVPLKARVDVLLTGHARSEAAMHVLPAGFAVDKLRRRFYATTEEPSAVTPLLSEHLRTGTGEATRVGARAMWAGTLDGAAIVGDDGVPCAPIPRGFDYTAFNVAPPEQQLEMLSLTAQIVLDGLTPGGRRTARLPGIRPRVFAIPESGFGPLRPPDEVVLRCDTLWIDADRCLAMLTWRGVIPISPGAHAAPSLVLALDEGDRKKTWARAVSQLDDAVWSAASGPEDASEAPEIEPEPEPEDDHAHDHEDDGPTTDRMTLEVAASLAEVGRPALSPEDEEATRTHVHLPRASALEILVEDEPSTHRRGALSAVGITPGRAPLLVLGGLGGALASFAVKRPPERPQRPADLQFGRAEDFTGVAIGITVSREDVTSTVLFTAPDPISSHETTALPDEETVSPPAGATPALPFVAQGAEAPPLARPTTLLLDPNSKSPTPARQLSRPITLVTDPNSKSSRAALPFSRPVTLLLDPHSKSAKPDLPFAPASSPAAVAPEVQPFVATMKERTVGESLVSAGDSAPALATSAAPPAAEAAPSALGMERYAEIKAEIWGSGASVADVLQRCQVDEAEFHEHERRLAEGLAREAAEGRTTLAIALREAIALARDQQPSAGDRPLRTLEEAYVTLVAAIDRAEDPSAILAAEGMSPAEWRRLRRRFEERSLADAQVRDALSTRLAAARKAAGDDAGGGSKWWNRRETAPARAKRVPAKRKG